MRSAVNRTRQHSANCCIRLILIVMGYWRRSPNFLRQATIANVVMMGLGIWLTFNQVAGYIAST